MGLKQHQSYRMDASFYDAPAPAPWGLSMEGPVGPFGYPNPSPLFPAIRLHGLPFKCSEVDVVNFLWGLDLVNILFVHKRGHFAGDAYVILAYPAQVEFVLIICLYLCYSTSLV
jgi:heterogeneous nuclear ribonucleoprotein F/H